MIFKKYSSIPVDMPEMAILKRMGYNRHLTGIPPVQKEMILSLMQDAYELCRPVGRYAMLNIILNDGEMVELENGLVFESPSIAELLAKSNLCIMLAAKADEACQREIAKFVGEKNGVGALVFDAVASEVVDDCLPWMLARVNQEYSRLGRKVTKRRFSAGYGDFKLENQWHFQEVLRLEEIGVSLSENCIFSPEKTVTALAGLE